MKTIVMSTVSIALRKMDKLAECVDTIAGWVSTRNVQGRFKKPKKDAISQKLFNLVNVVTFLMYPGLSVKIFSVFKCVEVDPGEFYQTARGDNIVGEMLFNVLGDCFVTFFPIQLPFDPALAHREVSLKQSVRSRFKQS